MLRAFVLVYLAVGPSNSFRPRHPRVSTNRRFAKNIMINESVLADGNAEAIKGIKGGRLDDGSNGSNWRVWRVINELETKGLSASLTAKGENNTISTITSRVVCVLKKWANEFAGMQTWQSLLNKNALLHEVSRSRARGQLQPTLTPIS